MTGQLMYLFFVVRDKVLLHDRKFHKGR